MIVGGNLSRVISALALEPVEARAGDTEEIRPWSRMPGLDAVRAVAITALVANHLLLVLPAFAVGLGADGEAVSRGRHGGAWWMTYTPLHLLWDAQLAGWFFLLLSGLLLALPAAAGRWPQWSRFYPGRAVRVGLPLLGAVALVAVLGSLLPAASAGSREVLVPLGWVLAGSLLLPVLLHAAKLLAPIGPAALLVPAMTLGVGDLLGLRPLVLLSVYAVGVQLAFLRERLVGLLHRLWARPNAREVAVLGAGGTVLALNAVWLQLAFTDADSWLGMPTLGVAATALGATVLVGFAATLSRVRMFRLPGVLHWLASRSFSLFLVHQPVFAGTAGVLGVWANLFSLLLFGVPVLLLVTEVFHRAVEAPSVRLADRVAGMAEHRMPQLRALVPSRSRVRRVLTGMALPAVSGPATRSRRMAIRPRHATDTVVPGPSVLVALRDTLRGAPAAVQRLSIRDRLTVPQPVATAAFSLRRTLASRRR